MPDRCNRLPDGYFGAALTAVAILLIGAVLFVAADRWFDGDASLTQDEMASEWLMAEERTCKVCTLLGGGAGKPPERICGTRLDWARLAPRVRSCRPA